MAYTSAPFQAPLGDRGAAGLLEGTTHQAPAQQPSAPVEVPEGGREEESASTDEHTGQAETISVGLHSSEVRQ